jgi:hypothetical protein
MSAMSFLLASLLVVGGALAHEADSPAAAVDAQSVEAAGKPAIAAGGPSAAGDAIVAQSDQATLRGKSAEDPNERVCKYVVQTGTRMGSKKCHTRAYWDDMELAARNKMREIDSQPIPVHGN